MTPEQFTLTCKRLFGRGPKGYGWQAEMHRQTGCPLRTIQAWVKGDNPVPGIVASLLQIAHNQLRIIQAWANSENPIPAIVASLLQIADNQPKGKDHA